MLGRDITLEDLEDMDPQIYKGLKSIVDLEDVESLYLTFSYE